MKVTPPKSIVWWISFILGALALLTVLHVISLPGLAPYTFWMAIIGLGLMLIATRVKGL
jgi:hypothetical protein